MKIKIFYKPTHKHICIIKYIKTPPHLHQKSDMNKSSLAVTCNVHQPVQFNMIKSKIQIHPPTNKTSFIAFPCLQQELQLTYAVNENKSPDPHIPRSIDFHGLLVSIHA